MSRRACSALLAALAIASGAGRIDAASLTVPRTPAPAGVSRSVPHALPSAVSSTADVERIAKTKRDAWRSMPDVFSHPSVDWSPHANRRKGWRPRTTTPLVRSHRSALQALGVPPAPEPDTFRVAFIRIDFARDSEANGGSTGNGRFDLSTPGAAAVPIDRPPHNRQFYLDHFEALRRYYDAQSYGRTVITGDVWPRTQNGAYTCTDMADFGPWKFSTSIYGAAVHMFRSMMFAADTQSTAMGDRIPWDQYDRFVIIHAGSDLQSDVSRDSPEDIPSFTLGVGDTDVVIFRDSTEWNREHPITQALFVPEHVNQDGYYGAINGVIAHECGHLLFGFVDLYNVDTGYPVVGLWSLMDSGNLAGSIVALQDGTNIFATGLLPPSVDPWQRSFATDALTFQPVAYGDTMALKNSERYPDMRRVDLTSDEYLILENRWLAPSDSVELDQADSTRVILGPKKPDRYEYDALLPVRVDAEGHTLPGAGILAWHIDESVIPFNEFFFPCDTARANPGCGFNTNPSRLAISVLEADGLADLGDPNSPYILGAPRDPWFRSNNPSLGDSTRPNLRPHIGTYPHIRLDFLDEPDSIMHFAAFRTWQLPGWPVQMPFPKGGPQPLAIDLDGDRLPEVVWAGGRTGEIDSAAVIAVPASGQGYYAVDPARLGRRPNPVCAAIQRNVGGLAPGPAVIAVSTLPGPGGTAGKNGRVWLIDHLGNAIPGWPALLPSQVTTPPVIAHAFQDTFIYVGCADGFVYALDLQAVPVGQSAIPLAGGVRGRLAVFPEPLEDAADNVYFAIAAGGGEGDVTVLEHVPSANDGDGVGMPALPGWPVRVAPGPVAPDFLFLDFGGRTSPTQETVPASGDCTRGALSLVVHHADRLWAYCLSGQPLPGWGQSAGDTIVAGLAAGDPDGDGFPEVITQTIRSEVAFWDLDGRPQPGWPKRGTTEDFRSGAAPIAADLNGANGTDMITLNASGIVDAFDARGRQPAGWPLATGLGAVGTPLLADLNGDRQLELVVADSVSRLYAYSLPTTVDALAGPSWPMLGGDPQRSSSLPAPRTPVSRAAAPGPLVRGSLKAYPNPARKKPVTFAYTLTEPGSVEFRILDTSGHEVASFERTARQADNVETWDPGALPAGLYVARLKFKGASSERVETVPIGLLR